MKRKNKNHHGGFNKRNKYSNQSNNKSNFHKLHNFNKNNNNNDRNNNINLKINRNNDNNFKQKVLSVEQKSIVDQRHSLPVFVTRGRLLKYLKNNETVVIIADTGCGKTTQIPQYIHEERLDSTGGICITQPRRVAAISIAKRVSEEMFTPLGGLVGYSVRFEEACSFSTKLKFVTDGILLRESMLDPLLEKYSWIILDEVHERTVCTDILFGVIKAAQAKRKALGKKALHIVVMSATMDVDHISNYFNKAPVLYIEGREHPITMYYSKVKDDDYAKTCMKTVFKIHREAPPQKDILLFMTGQEEIDTCVRNIKIAASDDRLKDYPKMKVYPLYAALPSTQQLDVFNETAAGERKVIVSTNIAETSLTIPGICYVIDSGKSKVRTHNASNGFDSLKVQWISQAQAWQRTGRAGRITDGYCYRAYTINEFNSMKKDTVPEILRTNLASALLQILNVGVKNVFTFDFVDKPPIENVKKAFESLVSLGAVTIDGDEATLTDTGKLMSQFPIEPRYSKIILCGQQYQCTHEVSSISEILVTYNIIA